MKVCMVTDSYYPYVGGIAEHVFHLASELRRAGHSVSVLTSEFRESAVLETTIR